MVQLEVISVAISMLTFVAQNVYSYFNKKGFQERFEKYKDNLDSKLRKEAKQKINEMKKQIQKESLDALIDLSKTLADKLDNSQKLAREYFNSYRNLRWFHLLIFISILMSLMALYDSSGTIGQYRYIDLGFSSLIIAIAFLAYIIFHLQELGEKVLSYELKISQED